MEEYSMPVLSYNTERARLHIPEYGRNVQNMINYAKQIESREERNSAVKAIIDVMGQLNPHLRDVEDYTHKLWTHLYVMSNFEIDVDCPYELPTQEKLNERPKIMEYPTNKSKYGHFGHYAEEMIKVASELEDEDSKEYLAATLANLLKKNYLAFHTTTVENTAILSHLRELSKGKLSVDDSQELKTTNAILKELGLNRSQPVKKKSKARKRRK